jgi:transposase
MGDATCWTEILVGLDRIQILNVDRVDGLVVVTFETTDTVTWCDQCGGQAQVKDRSDVALVDLPVFGTPSRLVWRKRRWKCPNTDCDAPSATETRGDIAPARSVMTTRAGIWATLAVGREIRPVTRVAAELGVGWSTVMDTVRLYGNWLIADPDRLAGIQALGVDETKFLAGTRERRTSWVTAICDVARRFVADIVEDRNANAVTGWVHTQPDHVTAGVTVVVSDMSNAYAGALRRCFPDATYVVDRFHVVQAGNRVVDETRRRVQNETRGHRGRKDDPLYRARKLALIGEERLDDRGMSKLHALLEAGDPHGEVFEAWAAKEAVRSFYEFGDLAEAEWWLDETIEAARTAHGPEVKRLGRMLNKWRTEIMAFHTTRLSNGPVEGLNSIIKKIKRVAAGFRSFANYRCRILLACGNVNWQLLNPAQL